jgi:ABC-2 type transport system permease protein
VVFTLAFPVILLLFFSSVVNYRIPGNLSFSQYFVPGVLAAGLFGVSFQTLAIQVAIERDKGILKRLEGTPMPPSAYFIGKIVMVFTMVALETVVLLGIARALGKVALPTDAVKWLHFVWLTVLGVAAGSVLGIAFSSLARSGKSAPATVTPVAIVLQFISGVYFVFSQSPAWLREVASVFPLRWIAQGYRSVFLPDSYAQQEVAHQWQRGTIAVVLAVWTVAGLLLTLRTFRWRNGRDA